MKILHFADLHLGVESYGRLDPETGLSTRLGDFLRAFDRLVDFALENGVDIVIFCGDAYKSREPSQTQQREFARRISRLVTNDIPVFLLVGNHDLPNAIGKATTTEIFHTLEVNNVYVANRPDIYRIETRSGVIQVASLPWLRRGTQFSREENRSLTLDQVKERMQRALTVAVANQASKLDPALPSVLAAHVWVTGAQVGSEKSMTIGQEPALLVSNVANLAFDYVALGHIHRHQVLRENPPVVYSGSLERVDFGEEGAEKGFCVVDIAPGESPDKRRVSFQFHQLSGRRFQTISVDVAPEDSDPTATVLRAINEQGENVRNAVVRLQVSLPAGLAGQLRDGEVRQALKDAYYATVARDIRREARLRLGDRAAEEIAPLDALKAWLDTQKYPPERAKLLLEYGERLMRGEKAGG